VSQSAEPEPLGGNVLDACRMPGPAKDTIINLILCFLFWIPGILNALYPILKQALASCWIWPPRCPPCPCQPGSGCSRGRAPLKTESASNSGFLALVVSRVVRNPFELDSGRVEAVVLTGETFDHGRRMLLPIIRTDAGGFFGFGEDCGPQLDNFQGRFAQLLPPKRPSAEGIEMARAMLAAMGVTEGRVRENAEQN